MPASRSRSIAATTAETDIKPGTPEEAYQAINLAKMLWGFRLRDVDSWQDVIERWTATKPEAWKRIPDDNPIKYGSPRAMIEAELETDYDQFKEFVRIVLGTKYAALIDEPYQDRPGGNNNPWGASGKPDNQPCAHKVDSDKQYGTVAHFRQQIKKRYPEALDQIGKGKEYKTVTEAARKLGIRADRQRLCFYSDDPIAAAHYLSTRVDKEWFLAMVHEYMKALEE